MKPIQVGLLGIGTVGGGVWDVLNRNAGEIERRAGRAIRIAQVADKGPYDGGTPAGALSNAGYQAALFNAATMKRVGLLPPFVWIDVEHVPHFEWSNDTGANAAVLRGAVRGYESQGFGVGLYSVPSLWASVVGDLALRLPEWRAAGHTSAVEARNRCESSAWSFGGGPGVAVLAIGGRPEVGVRPLGRLSP